MFAATWGYRNDGDAGLMHVGARYYDAQVGRFITRDTVLSEHPYLYCEHEPVNSVDPSGHLWWHVLILVVELVLLAQPAGEPGPRTSPGPPYFNATPTYPTPVIPDFNNPTIGPSGWIWRGSGLPGSGKGSWVNPNDPNENEYVYPDMDHPGPEGGHWDWRDPGGNKWRLFPDGRIEPK
jgi:RHS repeat-associated protein